MEQKRTMKELGTALLLSLLVTFFFLAVLAFLMLKAGLSEDTISKLWIVGYVLAPAAGGFFMGKRRKVSRFLWGMLVGALYFVVYAVLAIGTQNVEVGQIAWVAIPVCLGGMAGGMLS